MITRISEWFDLLTPELLMFRAVSGRMRVWKAMRSWKASNSWETWNMLRLDVMWILGRLARSDSLLKHHPKLFVCAWLLLLGSVHKVHFTVYSFGFHELTHISRDPAVHSCFTLAIAIRHNLCVYRTWDKSTIQRLLAVNTTDSHVSTKAGKHLSSSPFATIH